MKRNNHNEVKQSWYGKDDDEDQEKIQPNDDGGHVNNGGKG